MKRADFVLLKFTLTAILVAYTSFLKAQVEKFLDTVENEVPPEYPGGQEKFYGDVANFIEYPSSARRKRIEGRVFVEFAVEKNGKMSAIKVVKGIGGGCDEACIKAMTKLNQEIVWKPGAQNGVPVRVSMVMPIVFKHNRRPKKKR